jgi:hypothetical protein
MRHFLHIQNFIVNLDNMPLIKVHCIYKLIVLETFFALGTHLKRNKKKFLTLFGKSNLTIVPSENIFEKCKIRIVVVMC